MISFSQLLILLFLGFLVFGDLRKLFNRLILMFVNFKTLFQKTDDKKESSSTPEKK